jgi:heme-degrading monooxygenase HmoA
MYAVVRRYTIKPGGAKELAARVEREFVPIIKAVPGFVSYMYLEGGQEWGRDVLATISVYSSREGAEASVRAASKWVGENLGDFEPSQPSVTAGEVLYRSE